MPRFYALLETGSVRRSNLAAAAKIVKERLAAGRSAGLALLAA
jgi:hypothetical protein